MSEKTVYLDNNATTMVDPQVFEAMKPYFCDLYGNPSSMHEFGGQVMHAVDKAREQVKDFLGARDAKKLSLLHLALKAIIWQLEVCWRLTKIKST